MARKAWQFWTRRRRARAAAARSRWRHAGGGHLCGTAALAVEDLESRHLLALTPPLGASAESVTPAWFQSIDGRVSAAGAHRATLAATGQAEPHASGGEWIVRLGQATLGTVRTVAAAAAYLDEARLGIEVVRGLGLPGQLLVRGEAAAADVRRYLLHDRGVAYAEPNRSIRTAAIPNDPRYGELASLDNSGQTGGTPGADIDAPGAWRYTTGSRSVVVGVIDSGIDYTHEDLVGNIWTNPGEIPDDGVDNDGNGFVDDVHGYDFANDDGDPMDDYGHGTHVAGTIGAVGDNGVGVTGVAWQVSLMAIKLNDATGAGTTADSIAAINYATMMRSLYGVNVGVTNNSWGGTPPDQGLRDAIDAGGAAGILFVAAAGNDLYDMDQLPDYPAAFDSPAIVCVAATDDQDGISTFSNVGLTTVDLAAPGVNILSTIPGNAYGTMSGTSMAAPHVAGTAALMLTANPALTVAELKAALLDTVDELPELEGLMVTGGRLDAARAVQASGLAAIALTPALDGVVSSPPTVFTVTFNHAFDPATAWASACTVNGVPADSFVVRSATTIDYRFASSPVTNQGRQSVALAAGAVVRAGGRGPSLPLAGSFRYDAHVMAVTSTTPADGSTVAAPLARIELALDEDVAAASVGIDDLVLSSGRVTAATVVSPRTVRYEVSGASDDGPFGFALGAGALLDAFGNPSQTHAASVMVDVGTAAFPVPLEPIGPRGSLAHGGMRAGWLADAADEDAFTLQLDAGQSLSVVTAAVGAESLRVRVQDPGGTIVAAADSTTGGASAVLASIRVSSAGTWTVTVTWAPGGPTPKEPAEYGLQLAVNACPEAESVDGPANDAMAASQSLDPAFVSLGSAAVATVLGDVAPPAGSSTIDADWYSLTLGAGTTISAAVAETQAGTTLALRDAAGTLLATAPSQAGFDGVFESFRAPAAGTYFLVVTGAAEADYSLVVSRNAGFETGHDDSPDAARPLLGDAAQGHAALGHVTASAAANAGAAEITATAGGSTPNAGWFESLQPHGAVASAGHDEWIIRLSATTLDTVRSVAAAAAYLDSLNAGLEVVRGLGLPGQLLVRTAASAERVRNSLHDVRGVAYAEPNRAIAVRQSVAARLPDDPRAGELWGLDNSGGAGSATDADIDAPEAWRHTTGSRSVVVAVVDSGIDYTHEDLVGNVWTNPGEIPDDGLDNDGNGFVDDVHGYDFAQDDGNPWDDDGHGTHVAGTIGAVGDNGVGVTGVAWQVSLMALKFLDAAGAGDTARAVLALNYATMMRSRYGVNVRVTNNSWGGGPPDRSIADAIDAGGSAGILFVTAAGNSGLDIDQQPVYPATFDSPYIVSVGATDARDQLASFSNYGAASVDLAAPGDDILSTLPGNAYGTMSGTSQAAPFVSGVAALALAADPSLGVAELRRLLLDFVDPKASLADKTVTGGRLNAEKVLRSLDFADFHSVPVATGDVLEITTLTPGDGTGEFVNTLDPQVEIFAPDGSRVAVADGGAADGRNVLLRHAATQTGLYRLRVTAAAGAGEYVLRVTGATGTPAALPVIAASPSAGAFRAPPPVTLTFGSSLLLTSVAAGDLRIDGRPATGVTVVDDRTLSFRLPANLSDGHHTVRLAPGAVRGLDGTANDAFSLGFTLDLVPPKVVASSITRGEVLVGAAEERLLTLTFSERLDETVIGTASLTLVGLFTGARLSPSSIRVDTDAAGRTLVNARFTSVAEDAWILTTSGGSSAFRDLVGNRLDGNGDGTAGDAYRLPFSVDGSFTLADGIAPLAPLGGLVYRSTSPLRTVIGTPGDVDDLFIDIGASITTLSARIETTAGLRAAVTVLDPFGEVLGRFVAAGPGQPIVIPPLAMTTIGACTLRFSGMAGGTGMATTIVTLGADVEREGGGGPANDRPAWAQRIGTSAAPVGGATRTAVLGRIEPSTVAVVTDGFESATLGSAWTSFTADARLRVMDEPAAAAGSRMLLMDSTVDAEDRGRVEAVLAVDLSGLSGASLGFSHRNFGDEDDPFDGAFTGHAAADGVAISADGVTWHPIWNATGDESAWGRHTIDLAAAAVKAGIPLGPGFRIGFQYHGLASFPFGGRGWDDVVVSATTGGDVDNYVVELPAGRASFAIAGDAGAGIALRVLDANGVIVAAGSPTSDLAAAVDGRWRLSAGTYRVQVRGATPSDYCLVVVAGGRLEIENDSAARAQGLSPQDTVLGHIGRPGAAATDVETDVYAVSLLAGQILTAETLTPAADLPTLRDAPDMKLAVFAPGGGLLADDDASGADGRNARLVVTAPVDGVYTIVASSWGDGSGSYAVTVSTVTNRPPRGILLSATVIAENEPPGTVVGRFSTVDPDAGDAFTYSLVTGPGCGGNSAFEIVGRELRTARALNHEARARHSIRVRSTDREGMWRDRVFTITVVDRPEAAAFELVLSPAAGVYTAGDVLRFTLVASQPLEVRGVPLVDVWIGSMPRLARYESGAGTKRLTFAYVVAPGDLLPAGAGVTLGRTVHRPATIRGTAGLGFPLRLPAVDLSGIRVEAMPRARFAGA